MMQESRLEEGEKEERDHGKEHLFLFEIFSFSS